MTETFNSDHDKTAFRASIMVQLKSIPMAVRANMASRDWQERELAEKMVARLVVDGMKGFTVTRNPVAQDVAVSQREKRHEN
ncbi:MAG: hypothetical protein AAFO77_00685 [Pseudomonadota bacterium]